MPLSENWFEGIDLVDHFISQKDGNDTTGTGTQAAPKQTLDTYVNNKKNILRSGVYETSIGVTTISLIGNGEIIGDSENTFIKGTPLTEISGPGGGGQPVRLKNLYISNVNRITISTGSSFGTCDNCFIIGSAEVDNNGASPVILPDLVNTGNIYKNITIFRIPSRGYHEKCNFIDCSSISMTPLDANAETIHIKNYFENSALTFTGADGAVLSFSNCVFDENTTLDGTLISTILGVAATTSAASINKVTINGYALTGTRTANFNNCYWVDRTANPNTPLFNDDANNDYSLTLSSTPQGQSVLFNDSDIVGARSLALTLNADSAPFLTGNGATLTNITKNGSLFDLTTPGEGTVTSVPLSTVNIAGNIVIKLPLKILLTDAIRFFGNLLPFNALSGTGEVVDRVNYPPDVRYTIRLRYWDDDETPGNEVKPAGGGWYEIEHGNIFGVEIDGFNRGNGNIDVDTTDLSPIFADKFQVEFVLRDNGN